MRLDAYFLQQDTLVTGVYLLRWKQLFKAGFIEDGHAERLGFVKFRAGITADNDVASFFADGRASFASVGSDELFGLFPGAALKGAGKNETLAGKLGPLRRGAIFFHIDA